MGFSFKVSGPDAGIVKRQKAKVKAKGSGPPQPSELNLLLTRRSGQSWGFSLSDNGVVDGVHDDSPAAKAVRSPGLNPNALRCGDRIVAIFVPSKGGMVATPTGRAAKDLIKGGLDRLDVKIQRGKRAVVKTVAKTPSTQTEATQKESTQKASWRLYHREKLLKDLPKWKLGHKEDMHTRLHKVFKSYPDLSSDRELINAVTDHFQPYFYTGLNFASVELCDDRDIVLRAVLKGSAEGDQSKAGNALGFASARLADEEEVVLAAMTGNTSQADNVLGFASARLRANPFMRKMQKAAMTDNKKKLAEVHAALADATGKRK